MDGLVKLESVSATALALVAYFWRLNDRRIKDDIEEGKVHDKETLDLLHELHIKIVELHAQVKNRSRQKENK